MSEVDDLRVRLAEETALRAQAEQERDEYEKALEKIADNRDAAVLTMDGKEIEPWQNKRGDWQGSPRLIARAALAASGERSDTAEAAGRAVGQKEAPDERRSP